MQGTRIDPAVLPAPNSSVTHPPAPSDHELTKHIDGQFKLVFEMLQNLTVKHDTLETRLEQSLAQSGTQSSPTSDRGKVATTCVTSPGAAATSVSDQRQNLMRKQMGKFQAQEILGHTSDEMQRTKKASERSEQGQRDLHTRVRRRFLVHPQSRFRLLWDGVSCLLILFLAVSLPYRIAFVSQWSLLPKVVDFMMDIFFLVDIGINCRTMYYDDDSELIDAPRQILCRYARTWMPVDVVATIPVEWFLGVTFDEPVEDAASTAQHLQLLRILRLLKLLRLLRVARCARQKRPRSDARTQPPETRNAYLF